MTSLVHAYSQLSLFYQQNFSASGSWNGHPDIIVFESSVLCILNPLVYFTLMILLSVLILYYFTHSTSFIIKTLKRCHTNHIHNLHTLLLVTEVDTKEKIISETKWLYKYTSHQLHSLKKHVCSEAKLITVSWASECTHFLIIHKVTKIQQTLYLPHNRYNW
jgi:hypothetical protein